MGIADELEHPSIDGIKKDFTVGAIPIHHWSAAWEMYARGEATYDEIKALFGLEARGVTAGSDQLKAVIDALGTENQKLLFIMKMEAAGLFYETGQINKTRYKQIMGLSD
jgi:hypothetical protein